MGPWRITADRPPPGSRKTNDALQRELRVVRQSWREAPSFGKSRQAPPYVTPTLQLGAAAPWRDAVLNDMVRMRGMLSPKLDDLVLPREALGRWEDFVRKWCGKLW